MAVEYLRAKGVPDLIDEAVSKLLKEQPDDVSTFLLRHFQEVVEKKKAVFAKGAEVEVHGMLVDTALNGEVGKVVGRQDEVVLKLDEGGIRHIAVANIRSVANKQCLEVGDAVQVVGMTLDKAANDKRGKVLEFVTKVFVSLPSGHRALHSNNLIPLYDDSEKKHSSLYKPGTTVEVHNMLIDTSLNGQKGVIKSTQESVVVRLEDSTIKMIPLYNLKAPTDAPIERGSEVEIHGMSLDKTLNGAKGVVKSINLKVSSCQ
eukprot:TRINITY_DN2558_c0_g1_i2.p1 TRINITY_DN2558_c0_g1~~TRINITY_DN2558_c0_g1_i2.p1  ORF type:complete len:260 (+),score=63.59 TRINITY_DN2558_c0_g1_i2:36-815(+)